MQKNSRYVYRVMYKSVKEIEKGLTSENKDFKYSLLFHLRHFSKWFKEKIKRFILKVIGNATR